MSRYALSPLAQADLSDIWDYSYSQWGADQADAYVLVIHEACEGLVTAMANGRLAGQSAEYIRTGYRKQIVRKNWGQTPILLQKVCFTVKGWR